MVRTVKNLEKIQAKNQRKTAKVNTEKVRLFYDVNNEWIQWGNQWGNQ